MEYSTCLEKTEQAITSAKLPDFQFYGELIKVANSLARLLGYKYRVEWVPLNNSMSLGLQVESNSFRYILIEVDTLSFPEKAEPICIGRKGCTLSHCPAGDVVEQLDEVISEHLVDEIRLLQVLS